MVNNTAQANQMARILPAILPATGAVPGNNIQNFQADSLPALLGPGSGGGGNIAALQGQVNGGGGGFNPMAAGVLMQQLAQGGQPRSFFPNGGGFNMAVNKNAIAQAQQRHGTWLPQAAPTAGNGPRGTGNATQPGQPMNYATPVGNTPMLPQTPAQSFTGQVSQLVNKMFGMDFGADIFKSIFGEMTPQDFDQRLQMLYAPLMGGRPSVLQSFAAKPQDMIQRR